MDLDVISFLITLAIYIVLNMACTIATSVILIIPGSTTFLELDITQQNMYN